MMVYLGITGPTLSCHSDSTDPGWSIKTSEIVLVAEYTTDEGQFADDYHLVFVTREHGEFFYSSVTMNANGVSTALEEIEKQLGSPIELKLFTAKRWASRVAWPHHLAGLEYLEREESRSPAGWWEWLLSKFRRVKPAYRVSNRLLQALVTTVPRA